MTRPPKPTPRPSPIPTATPVPTPVPLPPSAFYALWAESFPEGQGSVLWLTDPRDIGNRQEVLRFERDAIAEVTLSPNGRKLALVTTYWKTATLWVANADGSDLQRLEQGPGVGGPLFWSRDSRLLTYGVAWREETTIPSYKTGTPVAIPVWRGAIELLDVATGEKRRLLEPEPDTSLSVLGWSANGQELFYAYVIRRERGDEYQLWAIDRSGQDAHSVTSLGEALGPPFLSSDGSKFLISTPEGLAWISADGRERGDIPIMRPERGYQALWSPEAGEVIVSQIDEQRPIAHVNAINVRTGGSRNLDDFRLSPSGYGLRVLGISPDRQWLTVSESTGLYLAHLPTGATVPIPSQNRRVIFVAWVPRMSAGQ